MNITGTVDIKQPITEFDKAHVVDFVSSFIVGIDTETSEKYYRPYYMNTAIIIAVAKYIITGVEYEEGENVYLSAASNTDVAETIERFVKNFGEMDEIKEMVDDVIEFKKQCIIHENININEEVIEILNIAREAIEKEKAVNEAGLVTMQLQNQILEYQNEVNKQFTPEENANLVRKMSESDFDMSKIAELVTSKYFGSDKHVEKLEEVIDSDKEKIRDLNKYKALHDARNVLNQNGNDSKE